MSHDRRRERQHAHDLFERPPPHQLTAVIALLEAIIDPVPRAIAQAPVDDEPVTAQEEKALAEAHVWLKDHKPIADEQVLVDLCITEPEIDNYQDRA